MAKMARIEAGWANLLRDLSSSDSRAATGERVDELTRLADHPLLLRQHLLRGSMGAPHPPLILDVAVLASSQAQRDGDVRPGKLAGFTSPDADGPETGSPMAFQPSDADFDLALDLGRRSPDDAPTGGVAVTLAALIRSVFTALRSFAE